MAAVAQAEFSEVAMQVAQAALDGCEAGDDAPTAAGAGAKKVEEGNGSALITSLLQINTPVRNPRRPEVAKAAPAASLEAPKGPEPWNARPQSGEGSAQRSAYRERLQARGHHIMHRPPAPQQAPSMMMGGQPCARDVWSTVPLQPPVVPQMHPGQCAWTAQAGQWMPMAGSGDASPMMQQQQQHGQPAFFPMMGEMAQYPSHPSHCQPGGAYQQAQLLSSPSSLPVSEGCYQAAPAAMPYATSGDLTPDGTAFPEGSPKSTGELLAVLMGPQGFCMDKDQLAEQLRVAATDPCEYED